MIGLVLILFFLLPKFKSEEISEGITILLYDKGKNPINPKQTLAIVEGTLEVGFIRLQMAVKNTNSEPLTCHIDDLITSGGDVTQEHAFRDSMSICDSDFPCLNDKRVLKGLNAIGSWTTDLIDVEILTHIDPYTFEAEIDCVSDIGTGPKSIGIMSNEITVSINNEPVCNNDIKELGELCDGTNLGGLFCYNIESDFDGGILQCGSDCNSWDTTQCNTPSTNICGDLVITSPEVCELGDDGVAGGIDDLNGETCVTQLFDGGILNCNDGCLNFDTNNCYNYVCGDGIKQGDEVCDDDDFGGLTCEDFNGVDSVGVLYCINDCGEIDTLDCSDVSSEEVIFRTERIEFNGDWIMLDGEGAGYDGSFSVGESDMNCKGSWAFPGVLDLSDINSGHWIGRWQSGGWIDICYNNGNSVRSFRTDDSDADDAILDSTPVTGYESREIWG